MTEKALNQNFMKMFFALALPVALQNVLTFSVGLMDSIMVGALGEVQLSAVTVANQPFFLYTMSIFGLATGACVLISQYWGKKDTQTIEKIFGMVIRIALLIGAAVTAVSLLFPEAIMSIYTNEADVIREGAVYLRWVAPSYMLFAVSSTYITCIRSVERVRIAIVVYSISFVVNVFFNYMFIFGKFGAPALGVAGAAVGTLLARASDFLIVMIYSAKIETRVKLHWKNLLHTDKLLFQDFIRFSIPVLINEMLWGAAFSAHTAVLGRMGVNAIATASIVNNVSNVACVLIYGAGSAALVITGKYIGAKQYDLARRAAPKLIWMNLAIAAVTTAAVFFLRGPIIHIYNLTPETIEMANQALLVMCLIIPFMSVNVSCIVGIFRGSGDTIFAMVVDIVFIWAVALPLGILFGPVLGFSVPVVFLLLRCDEIIRAFACLIRLKSGKWLRNVTRGQGGKRENIAPTTDSNITP